jgi:hypothetical protein
MGQICLFIYNARRRPFPCQPISLKFDPDSPGSLKDVQYTVFKNWLQALRMYKVRQGAPLYRHWGSVQAVWPIAWSTSIALPFHDHGTRRGWGVSVMPRPLFTPRKDPVPIVQEAGWVPVSTGAENLAPTRIWSLDRPARSESLYRLSYPAHLRMCSTHLNEYKCPSNLHPNTRTCWDQWHEDYPSTADALCGAHTVKALCHREVCNLSKIVCVCVCVCLTQISTCLRNSRLRTGFLYTK